MRFESCKCVKIVYVCDRGSAPDPTVVAYSAPQTLLLDLEKGEGEGKREGKERKEEGRGEQGRV